ncbi:MAG: CpXC domain-containing protein [Candidatus Heimdallarchaeota archaeon]
MTRTMEYEFTCSECNTITTVETHDSITTWLYPDLVQKILDDGYYFECTNCGYKYKIVKDILINTRKGIFMMDTGASLEFNKQQLVKYGVIDEQENILKQERKPPSEMEHDPKIASIIETIGKTVEDVRDGLLEEKD